MSYYAQIESAEQVAAALREDGFCIGVVEPDAYHAMKEVLPGLLGLREGACVSKSSLHEFAASPYAFRWRRESGRKVESSGFLLGSAVDAATLTPELYASRYTCEAIDRRTKAGKERARELEERGVTVLKPEESEMVNLAAEHATVALERRGLVLGESYSSQVGMWVVLERVFDAQLATPLILTGMLDICPHRGDALLDLKTTSKPVGNKSLLGYAVQDLDYGVQASVYATLFEACTGEVRGRFGFCFVGTEMPCEVRFLWMEREQLEDYKPFWTRLLVRFAEAVETGDWGSFEHEDIEYTINAKEREKIYS